MEIMDFNYVVYLTNFDSNFWNRITGNKIPSDISNNINKRISSHWIVAVYECLTVLALCTLGRNHFGVHEKRLTVFIVTHACVYHVQY